MIQINFINNKLRKFPLKNADLIGGRFMMTVADGVGVKMAKNLLTYYENDP